MGKYGKLSMYRLMSIIKPGELFSGSMVYLDLGCSKNRADDVLRKLWIDGYIERPVQTVAKYLASKEWIDSVRRKSAPAKQEGKPKDLIERVITTKNINGVGVHDVGLSKLEKMLYCGKLR